MDWTSLIGLLMSPIAGVISYFAGKKRKNNDFLQEMQASIDLLVLKNKELVTDVTSLRMENLKLIANQEILKRNVETLTEQNNALQKTIETLNEQLRNVKSITRKI